MKLYTMNTTITVKKLTAQRHQQMTLYAYFKKQTNKQKQPVVV